jgi:chemotaxis family two-component system response regulator Rcp1
MVERNAEICKVRRSKLNAPVRVLIVDDNEPDAYLVAESLRIAGIDFELTHVKDGVGLLEMLTRAAVDPTRPVTDLVFLDFNLPRTDGFELLAAMRKNPAFANVPIAVISSALSAQDQARALALGANCCLIKPLELNAFAEAIVGAVKKLLSSL